jgi:hypothetical protein
MRYAHLFLSALWLGGCSSHPDPIIDMTGVNRTVYEQDLAECNGFADQIHIEYGMARGAAAGAAAGAAVGVIRGRDIAENAGVGAVLGSSKSGVQGAKEKEQLVKRCLRYRGYRVLN